MTNSNFATTKMSKENLLKEVKSPETIHVTGNAAIDALKTTVCDDYSHEQLEWAGDSRLIMVTMHRRENLDEPMRHMYRTIKRVINEKVYIKVTYPICMNTVVREALQEILRDKNRIRIIIPPEVLDFHNFLSRVYFILMNSDGTQKEAPSLAKPVLVMKDTTKRQEGIAAGTLKLVGTDEEIIYKTFKQLFEDQNEYDKMGKASNPYGDGFASKRITDVFECKHGVLL